MKCLRKRQFLGRGAQLGDACDGCIKLVEDDIGAGVGQGVKAVNLSQGRGGVDLQKAMHEAFEVVWRRSLFKFNRRDRAVPAIAFRIVHV